MDTLQLRTAMVLGEDAVQRLRQAHILVLGLGGVGSYAAEALCRAGVGSLTVCDHDTVADSNRNRQLCALCSTVGKPKAAVTFERLKDINPGCAVTPLSLFYGPDTAQEILSAPYNYIIDAIDTVTAKTHLIVTAKEKGIPIVSALGTGNKLDPSKFEITDIYKTSVCPLARVMRQQLRKNGIKKHDVLFSTEQPCTPLPLEAPAGGRRSVPGSVSWVPGCAGLMLAGFAIRRLLNK